MSFTLQLHFNNVISTSCASKVNLATFKILKTTRIIYDVAQLLFLENIGKKEKQGKRENVNLKQYVKHYIRYKHYIRCKLMQRQHESENK